MIKCSRKARLYLTEAFQQIEVQVIGLVRGEEIDLGHHIGNTLVTPRPKEQGYRLWLCEIASKGTSGASKPKLFTQMRGLVQSLWNQESENNPTQWIEELINKLSKKVIWVQISEE